MAVDGSLIFDTKIDTDGVAKGTKQVSSKVIELKNKISSTEKEVANLTQELEKMANAPIKSDITEKLEKDIAKVKKQLRSLYDEADRIGNAKQADLTSMGFGTEYLDNMLSQDENWNKVQKQIDDTETKLQEYERELKQVKSAESNVTGKDTAEYAEKKKKLEDLSGKLNVYKAKLREAENEEKSNKKELKSTVDVFEQFSKALKNVYSRLKKAFNSTIVKTIKNIGKNTSHTNSQMNLLSKSLQRIKQALAGLLLYKVLQGGLEGTKEGIDNLAQVNPKVNENLSALITSLDYLKNSLATAFAPILNVVTPILTGFMDTLSTVTDKVAQFIATLAGQSSYTKAVKAQKDYAASLTDTTSAAKENTKATEENQKYLAGYDELNVMPDNSSSDTFTSTNNANEIVPSEMFTTSYITGGISDFAKRVKELFQKQDFEGLGQLAADKLNKAMSKINWSKIRNTAKKWAGNIAGFLNGAVEKLDWFLTGTTIGNGIMTAVDFAYTFLTTFNFTELGVGIANALNGLFSTIDWSELGATFGAVSQAIISTGFGFVTTFDWKKLGKSISDAINGFFKKIDWKQAANFVSEGVKGAFQSISTALKNVDWEQIGKDIGEFFANIDWWGILEDAGSAIWDALTGLLSFFSGISGKSKLVKTLGDLATNFKDFVGIAWDKLKKAYNNVLKPLAKWTIEKAVPILVETLAGAFNLLSKFIKKIPVSVLTGIAASVGTIVAAFKAFKIAQKLKENFDKIKTAFLDFKDKILQHPYATVIMAIATAVIGLISAMQEYSNEQWSNSSLKKEIDKTAELADKWGDLADEMSTEIEEINDTELTMKVDFENVDKMKERLKEIIEDGTIDESEEGDYRTIVDLLGDKVDGFTEDWNTLTLEEVDGKIVIKDNIDEVNKKLDDLVTNWEITQAKLTFSEIYSNSQTEIAKKEAEINALKEQDNSGESRKSLIDYIFEKSKLSRKESQILADELIKANGDFDKTVKSIREQFNNESLDRKKYKNLFGGIGFKAYNTAESSIKSLFWTSGQAWDNSVIDRLNEYTDGAVEYNNEIKRAESELQSYKDTSDECYKSLETLNGSQKDYNEYIKLSTEHGMTHEAVLSLLKDDGITTWEELEEAAKKSSEETNKSLDKTDGKWQESSKKSAKSAQSTADTVEKCTVKAKSSVDSNLAEGVPKSISTMWQRIKSVFTDGNGFVKIKDAIWGVFKDAINKLISGINSLIRKPFDMLNDAFDNVRNFEVFGLKVFDWLPKIEAPQIPKLATGTYVPANYGEFLAILGDNKREAEIVAPESKIKQAVKEAFAEIDLGGNGGGNEEINIYIDGDKVFKVVVDKNNHFKKSHGYSAFS